VIRPEDVRGAVRHVLDEHAGACRPEHLLIADAVVNRLAPRIPEGAGLFVRDLDDLDPETAARWLPWVAVCVSVEDRKTNRSRAWFERYQRAGGRVAVWTWFSTDADVISEAIAFGASVGALWYVLNGEKELRGRHALARRLAAHARSSCDQHGLGFGLVSYSVAHTVRDFPWRAFADLCDFGMPEIYDRRGSYDPDYPRIAIESWRDEGFRRIVPACGIYVRRAAGGWRWRTAAEILRHVGLFPSEHRGAICAWPIGTKGQMPESALIALSGAVG